MCIDGYYLHFSFKVHTCVQGLVSLSLLSFMRAAFAVVLMGSVHLMKLFRDFRRGTTPRYPLSGYLWSVVCRVRPVRLATVLLMYDGAIPASTGRLLHGICRLQTACDHSTGFIQCRDGGLPVGSQFVVLISVLLCSQYVRCI